MQFNMLYFTKALILYHTFPKMSRISSKPFSSFPSNTVSPVQVFTVQYLAPASFTTSEVSAVQFTNTLSFAATAAGLETYSVINSRSPFDAAI